MNLKWIINLSPQSKTTKPLKESISEKLYNRMEYTVVSNCLRPHGLWPTRLLCP